MLTLDSLTAPGSADTTSSTTSSDGGGASVDRSLDRSPNGSSSRHEGTFARVLRSKGLCWLDSQHRVMAAWSHAGRHFRLTPAGPWWVTLPDEVMRQCLSADADAAAYLAERAHFEGGTDGDGDRRQEVVFIGTELDGAAITAALDSCLATDAELAEYRMIWQVDEERLAAANGPFRFAVGEAVECLTAKGDWASGVVARQYHREAGWPTDRWVPYQVRLDTTDGPRLIGAQSDSDASIRRPRERA